MSSDTNIEPLVTERLVLRRSIPEDAEQIAAYRSDPDVQRYQGWGRIDVEKIREEIREMGGRAPGSPGWVQFTVEEREGGTLVGDVGMAPAEGEPGVIKIGYTIAPTFQGKGYATEAVRALVDFAFRVVGARVVRAYASAKNLPSIRVAENVGMRLVERIERSSGGTTFFVVRYEIGLDQA
jgi:RimJ/RimL family protein N-acetyltransferase